MPVTFFHMGPGLAFKSVIGRHFSVLMFGVAQVAIDIEPALALLFGWERLHGWTHTYAGATVIGAAVLLMGRPLCLPILRWWNAELRRNRLGWLAGSDELGWKAAAFGAFAGTWSHVALDSFMHPDMRPFAPFSGGNPWLDAIPVEALYLGCAVAGIAGIAIWFGSHALRRARHRGPEETSGP